MVTCTTTLYHHHHHSQGLKNNWADHPGNSLNRIPNNRLGWGYSLEMGCDYRPASATWTAVSPDTITCLVEIGKLLGDNLLKLHFDFLFELAYHDATYHAGAHGQAITTPKRITYLVAAVVTKALPTRQYIIASLIAIFFYQ